MRDDAKTGPLPILDELEACRSFTAMAEWLGACPLAVFVTHGHEIELICMQRDLVAGADYVRLTRAALMKRRKKQGPLQKRILADVQREAERLDEASHAG